MSGGRVGGSIRSIGRSTVVLGLAAASVVSAIGVVVVVAVGVGWPAGPAAAHTDLLQGSPGPGQRVGGVVDFVDLVFVAAVTDAAVDVRGPDGTVVAGETEVADGQIVRHRMEALDVVGRYIVDYRMISDDGDPTEASYVFDYEVDGVQPSRLGQVDVPDDPLVTVWRGVGVVAVVALGGVCVVLIGRLRRSRAALQAKRGSPTG